MNTRELTYKLSTFDPNESFYWHVCDGRCSGAELVWLPKSQQWLWRDLNSGKTGESDSLTIIQSAVDGDDSGLNRLDDLVTVELDGNTGTWITSIGEDDLTDLPDDSEVWTVGSGGVSSVDLIDAE